MEITPSMSSTSTQFLYPRLQFRPPFFSPPSILHSKSCCSLRNSLSSSSFPRKASTPCHQWRPQFTATRAVSDAVDSGVKPAIADPILAVKKTAAEVHADLRGTSIFLVGMNSAMKTSVGELIADVLRYYYFDSDSVVEEAAGKDPSGKSFRERDEDGFRQSETEVLKQLSSMGRLVVNAGNGAVQNSTNLALLRHGVSIWLDVPLDIIAKGLVGDGGHSTPDCFSETLSQLTQLYEENRDGYATADATISLQKLATKFGYDEFEQVTVEDMALEVLKEIGKLTRVKKMMEEAGRPF